jgi:hypothetical protein
MAFVPGARCGSGPTGAAVANLLRDAFPAPAPKLWPVQNAVDHVEEEWRGRGLSFTVPVG